MNTSKPYCIKTHFGSNSSLVASIKFGTYYNVNVALDRLQAISSKTYESINSFNEIESSVHSFFKILEQLQIYFEKSKSSFMNQQLLIPIDLLIKSTEVLSIISPHQFESNKKVKPKLEEVAKYVIDDIALVNVHSENVEISNRLFNGLSKLYLRYPSHFRKDYERFVETLLSEIMIEDVNEDKIYTIIEKDFLNVFHAISRSSILFSAMLQILLHYCVKTNLDTFFIHLSQSIVAAVHRLANKSVATYPTLNPIDMYPEQLQGVAILLQAFTEHFSDLEGLSETKKTENTSERLIKEILNKLSTLLKTSRRTYVTKILLTICIPYKFLDIFVKFSQREKLEFHVLIES